MAGWDAGKEADADITRNFPSRHRTDKTTLRDQLQVEHDVLDAAGTATGRHKIPSGNTAGRPATPPTGAIYINTQLGFLEYFDGTAWQQVVKVAPVATALTNKTGGALAVNDVVAIDTANDAAVALADTLASTRLFVVSLEAPADNASGKFQTSGVVTVKVNGAVTRGRYLWKSATAKALEDSSVLVGSTTTPPAGAVGVALTAAAGPGLGTVTALMFGMTAAPIGSYGVRNLVGQNDATLPDTKFGFSADLVTFWNPTDGTITVKSSVATVTNDVLLDNTNANGRDQLAAFGSSTWIHFYFVLTSGGVVRSRSSLTAPPTGPTLQAGEIAWAYAGAVRYNGTPVLVKTRMRGASVYYEARQSALVNGNATAETAVSLSSFVPPNALQVVLASTFHTTTPPTGSSAEETATLRVVSGSDFYQWLIRPTNANSDHDSESAQVTVPNISQQVFYLASSPTGGAVLGLSLWVNGYRVPNGGE